MRATLANSQVSTSILSRGLFRFLKRNRKPDESQSIPSPNFNDLATQQVIVNLSPDVTVVDSNRRTQTRDNSELQYNRHREQANARSQTTALFRQMAMLFCLSVVGVSAIRLFLLQSIGFQISSPISSPTNDGTEVGALDLGKVNLLKAKVDPSSESNSLPDLISFAKPSVVKILSQNNRGSGSGFIFNSNGLIITNHHVVKATGNIKGEVQVLLYDGTETTGKIIEADEKLDIALVKIYLNQLPALDLSSEEIKPGNRVIILGSPQGFGWSASSGIISALDRNLDEIGEKFLQTDAAINPGNSGGPILDGRGRVIGIVTSVCNNSENVGFGRSAHQIQEFIDKVKEKHGELF